jgi:ligand-binding sensor domain-containing protein
VWSFTPDTHGWDSYWSGQGNAVTSLAEYQGQVWAGLQDKGVAVISRSDKKVSTLTKKMKVFDRLSPGLVSNRVSVLTVVGEKLWIGTDSGISIIGPMASPVRLTYADGLLNDDILDIQQDTVYVWIGHNGGLTRIRKSSIAHLL